MNGIFFKFLKGAIPAVLELAQAAHAAAPDSPGVKKLDGVIAGVQTFVTVAEAELPQLKTEITAVVNFARALGVLPASAPATSPASSST